MASHKPWLKPLLGSVASPHTSRREKRVPFARTERRLNDVKKRFGKDYLDKLDVVDIGELPAFIASGRSKLSQRDLNLIGTVMDNHLGVSGFYVQASGLRFLVSTPEVGAIPLHKAIMDELNIKLMPSAKLDTERTLKYLKDKFGASIVKYLQKIDLLELLFDGD
ncbi:MAG: hypothetical protein KAI73_02545, partial [Rhodospirillaceae bacterium]|nr:hypothetical protein [Rhodospirillaceae bacterium]